MSFILLKKDNTFVIRDYDNGVVIDTPVIPKNTLDVFKYLNHIVLIEEGFTLRNFLTLMKNTWLNILHPNSTKCIKEMEKYDQDKIYCNPEYEYLEIKRIINYEAAKNIDYTEDTLLNTLTEEKIQIPYHDWFKDLSYRDDVSVITESINEDMLNGEEFDIDRDFHTVSCKGISFCTLDEILDLEIRISNLSLFVIEIDYNKEHTEEGIITFDKSYIGSEERDYYTFFDFIQSIMNEIYLNN